MRKNKNFFSSEENISLINWKSIELLKRYVTRFWNVKPSKYNGNTVKYQKRVRKAIIRARELGILEYIK